MEEARVAEAGAVPAMAEVEAGGEVGSETYAKHAEVEAARMVAMAG